MEKYTIELPKILYLTLKISKYAKREKYYNTNDLTELSKQLRPELVRTRKDKKDYKYHDDTSSGGLRGNFSTVLTLRGFIKRNNSYTTYYGVGETDRLFNALQNGIIILDDKKYYAYTNKEELKKLLEKEAKCFLIREKQAHIKEYIKKHKEFILERDKTNFPKEAVLKNKDNKYFLRILFNTFKNESIVEYNMLNYLRGSKIKKYNMHPLFAIPSSKNAFEEFYVMDAKEILENTPLFIYFDKKQKKFFDKEKNIYTHYTLEDGLKILSAQEGNITERLNYDWLKTKKQLASDKYVESKKIKKEEYSIFVEKFLKWKETFTIYNKDVKSITSISSGGPDVIIEFSGGTTKKIELEHLWNNYITHKHYISQAWKDVWLYADEPWDFEKIKKIFDKYTKEYSDTIPKVFLCTNEETKEKEGYEVDWETKTYKKIEIND